MYSIKEAPTGGKSEWQVYSHVRAQRTANWYRCTQATQTTQTNSHSGPLLPRTLALLTNQAHGAARLRLVHHDLGLVHPVRAARECQARHRRGLRQQHPRVGRGDHLRLAPHLHEFCVRKLQRIQPAQQPFPAPCSALLSGGTTHPCPVLGRLKSSSNVAPLHSNSQNKTP